MNGQRGNRLSLIISPSPSLLALSHTQRPPRSLDSVPIDPKNSRSKQVAKQRRLLPPFPSPPTMNPLLSGTATSDLPLIIFARTPGRLGPPVPRPPREAPPPTGNPPFAHHLRQRRRTPPNGGRRAGPRLPVGEPAFPSLSSVNVSNNEGTKGRMEVTETPQLKRPSRESSLPIQAPTTNLEGSSRVARNRTTPKRHLSVDATSSLDQITLTGVQPKPVPPSRSQSLRARGGGAPITGDGAPEETSPRQVNYLPEPLAEKKRVMNVRRAKKMQQVFGSEPPQALFQVTHVKEGENTEVFDKRDSVSTMLSISTANLLRPQSFSSRQRRVSTTSTAMVPTPPSTPKSLSAPQPDSSKTVLPRFERSFTRTARLTLPAFSNMLPINSQQAAAASGTSQSAPRAETSGRRKGKEFKQRRVRAAKLSKFFGVDYHDLEPHLVPEGDRKEIRKVQVSIDGRAGLPWDRRELRTSLEMEDVIARLRDLRSS